MALKHSPTARIGQLQIASAADNRTSGFPPKQHRQESRRSHAVLDFAIVAARDRHAALYQDCPLHPGG